MFVGPEPLDEAVTPDLPLQRLGRLSLEDTDAEERLEHFGDSGGCAQQEEPIRSLLLDFAFQFGDWDSQLFGDRRQVTLPHLLRGEAFVPQVGPVLFPHLGVTEIKDLAAAREFADDALSLELVAAGVQDEPYLAVDDPELEGVGVGGADHESPVTVDERNLLPVAAEPALLEMERAVPDEEPHGVGEDGQAVVALVLPEVGGGVLGQGWLWPRR